LPPGRSDSAEEKLKKASPASFLKGTDIGNLRPSGTVDSSLSDHRDPKVVTNGASG
jgi:hypothetical protein